MSEIRWDWDFLIHRHLSGEELTEEQRRALNDRLRKFPRLRKRLAEMAFEQVQFRDIRGVSEPVPILIVGPDAHEPATAPLLKPAAAVRRPWILPAVAAAACLALIVGLVVWSSGAPAEPFKVVAGDVKAEGSRVEVSGSTPAFVRMSDGSEAELAPASSANFRGRVGDARQVIELNQGAGKFKVAKAPDSFRIDTPSGRVSVLGTEFSVELRKQKKGPAALAVSVASGRVRVEAGGVVKELGPGESRVFGVEAPPEKKDPAEKKESRPVFSGVVQGSVLGKGDAHVLLNVTRVVSAKKEVPPELVASIPGRTLKVSVANAKRKDTDPVPDKIQFLFVRKLEIGQEITLDVRQIKGDDFVIGALDEAQAQWALPKEEPREDRNPKKKPRDPEKGPERGDKKEDK